MSWQIDKDKFIKALKKKGFKKVGKSRHDGYCFYYKGKQTPIFTVLSRGSKYKNLNASYLSIISSELHMTNNQLKSFIECSFTEDSYIESLTQKKII